LYVPSAYSTDTPLPVVVGFHGPGDNCVGFFDTSAEAGWTAVADSAPFILIVPDTKSAFGDFSIWWGNDIPDLEESQTEVNEILDLVDDLSNQYSLDLERQYAYGFSSGAGFLFRVGFHSTTFASMAIIAFATNAGPPDWIYEDYDTAFYMLMGTADGFYEDFVGTLEWFVWNYEGPVESAEVPDVGHDFAALMNAHSPATIYAWLSGFTL
jgi:poly(3-hydroxybutyrate) depolymerase